MIYCFTDGSIVGNPGGIGGYAAVLIYQSLKTAGLWHVLELGLGEKGTTNNRMEMMGPLLGISRVRQTQMDIKVYSDSQYVVRGMNEFLPKWKSNGGYRKKPNADLWCRLDAMNEKLRIEWKWLRGHTGHHWNELADKIAGQMVRQQQRGEEAGHENRYTMTTGFELMKEAHG